MFAESINFLEMNGRFLIIIVINLPELYYDTPLIGYPQVGSSPFFSSCGSLGRTDFNSKTSIHSNRSSSNRGSARLAYDPIGLLGAPSAS